MPVTSLRTRTSCSQCLAAATTIAGTPADMVIGRSASSRRRVLSARAAYVAMVRSCEGRSFDRACARREMFTVRIGRDKRKKERKGKKEANDRHEGAMEREGGTMLITQRSEGDGGEVSSGFDQIRQFNRLYQPPSPLPYTHSTG